VEPCAALVLVPNIAFLSPVRIITGRQHFWRGFHLETDDRKSLLCFARDESKVCGMIVRGQERIEQNRALRRREQDNQKFPLERNCALHLAF
jgi:hypothetical protein